MPTRSQHASYRFYDKPETLKSGKTPVGGTRQVHALTKAIQANSSAVACVLCRSLTFLVLVQMRGFCSQFSISPTCSARASGYSPHWAMSSISSKQIHNLLGLIPLPGRDRFSSCKFCRSSFDCTNTTGRVKTLACPETNWPEICSLSTRLEESIQYR